MNDELSTLLERFRGSERVERNRLIARFCGVGNYTASTWGRLTRPKGKPLNRLWYFLEAHGYEVDQLAKLHPTIRYLGRLVAFGLLSTSEALKMLQVVDHESKYLWRVLQGRLLPIAVEKQLVTTPILEERYGTALRQACNAAAKQGLIPASKRSQRPTSSESVVITEPAQPPKAVDSHITVAAAFINGLAPLVKRIGEDGPEAVAALRAAVDDKTFYATLDGLKAMASRRAHEFYHGRDRKGR